VTTLGVRPCRRNFGLATPQGRSRPAVHGGAIAYRDLLVLATGGVSRPRPHGDEGVARRIVASFAAEGEVATMGGGAGSAGWG